MSHVHRFTSSYNTSIIASGGVVFCGYDSSGNEIVALTDGTTALFSALNDAGFAAALRPCTADTDFFSSSSQRVKCTIANGTLANGNWHALYFAESPTKSTEPVNGTNDRLYFGGDEEVDMASIASDTAAAVWATAIESGISASASLVNDSGTQLTAIDARQMMAIIGSAVAAVLAGAGTTTNTMKPAGKPSASNRISATVAAPGNRTAITLRVPD